ncbi:Gfo/Idh/MocA family protein [Gemmobacter denitrificans]|uniref:Gfo/Idh/MocA family oxidoreductase n=1 Tax=Gemmobacter denitrificans TaxID=3123040 RepID=A0ABU8BQP5_9RHOB
MQLGVGLIGTGFMGKSHALAWRNVIAVLGGDLGAVAQPDLRLLCETPADKASQMAAQFGFACATSDWQELVADPQIDVVSITTPNGLHHPMAMAAIAAGKHVWCEKPMALTLAQAEEMAAAARDRGVVTMVGYNYLSNPAFTHAQRLVSGGAIGRPVQFRGWVDEDYQADPDLPWTWRARLQEAGLGALGDIGTHLISLTQGIMGPIASLIADMQTIHETRPLPDGSGRGTVENEDAANVLLRFANGAQGTLVISRSAWGRKSRLGFEIHGDRGMIIFDQERMNELQIYQNDGPRAEQGFKTILTGPAHPPYGAFCPAPGHQLGFNDLKVIECGRLLQGIAGIAAAEPGFDAALQIERVIHAIADSARAGGQRIAL